MNAASPGTATAYTPSQVAEAMTTVEVGSARRKTVVNFYPADQLKGIKQRRAKNKAGRKTRQKQQQAKKCK